MAAAAGLGAAAAMPAAAVMSTTGVAAEGENLCAHIEELAGAQHGQSPRAMSKLVRSPCQARVATFSAPAPGRSRWPGRSPPAVTQPLRTARTGARASRKARSLNVSASVVHRSSRWKESGSG